MSNILDKIASFVTSNSNIASGPTSSIPTTKLAFRYGGSFLQEVVQSFQQQDKADGNPCDELCQYLESGPESTKDVIGWWGVS